MARIKVRLPGGPVCEICGKGPKIGFNRPHSLHKTKRVVRPNLQKFKGVLMCTRCRRTVLKKYPNHNPSTSPR